MLDFMFVVFAGVALFGGLVMAFHENIVHSAFALVAALFGVAGLYWTLGADLLGATQILLYVGGVTVLLLFAVMLSTRDAGRISLTRYVLMAPVVGLLGMTLYRTYRGIEAIVLGKGAILVEPSPTAERVGTLFLSPDGYLLPFEVVAVLLLVVLVGAVTLARQNHSVAEGVSLETGDGGTAKEGDDE